MSNIPNPFDDDRRTILPHKVNPELMRRVVNIVNERIKTEQFLTPKQIMEEEMNKALKDFELYQVAKTNPDRLKERLEEKNKILKEKNERLANPTKLSEVMGHVLTPTLYYNNIITTISPLGIEHDEVIPLGMEHDEVLSNDIRSINYSGYSTLVQQDRKKKRTRKKLPKKSFVMAIIDHKNHKMEVGQVDIDPNQFRYKRIGRVPKSKQQKQTRKKN